MALYIRESGPSDAPSIVFLHGGGIGGWMWEAQAVGLSDYHCLIPDLPEHGQSQSETPFSIQDSAQRVADLIRTKAHGGRAHLVGLSIGGQIAVALLNLAPEVVDHALVTGTLVHPIPGAWAVGAIMALYAPFKDLDVMICANMQQYSVPEKYFEPFKEDTRNLTTGGFTRITKENMSFKLPAGLDRIKVPTLILVGQKEQEVVKNSARELLKVLSDSKAGIVSGVGHNWPLETPELFTNTFRAWITDQPLPQAIKPLT